MPAPKRRPRRYLILGGPLDGQEANFADFDVEIQPSQWMPNGRPPGRYADHRDVYTSYNRGRQSPFSDTPSMVFIHEDLL